MCNFTDYQNDWFNNSKIKGMAKSENAKKNVKKEAAKTPKEKKEEKRLKKSKKD